MKLLLVFIFTLVFLNVVRSADDFQKGDRIEQFFNDEPELFKMTTKDAQRQLKKEMRRRYKSPKIMLRNIKGKGKTMNIDDQYYTSSLTGEKVLLENFTHNNMTPFFGGRLKQNMNLDVNDSKLEMFTGTSKLTCDKNSEKCFNDVHNNVNDHQPQYISQFERMERPRAQNNVVPSEPIRVGPGYNKKDKFSSSPSGGFQQSDMIHDAGIYKSIDDLRTKNNPKTTYNGMVIPGQKESKRGEQSKLRRNRVETFYEKDEEDLFKTTGAYTKEAMKPCIDVKNTCRQETTVEYKGPVHDSRGTQVNAETSGPIKKKGLGMFGIRNANIAEGKTSDDDFGRKNIMVYQNGRDVTSTKTREGNITTMIKSLITPIQDFVRPTQKQYMVHSAREFAGNVNGPNKLTIYDPNGIARTTIKETTIHDTTTGNMRVNSTSIVYDPSDVAKTTLKETLKNYSNDINLKGANKPMVHDKNDKTRTTIRQTTENAERDGNISTVQHGGDGYRNANFNAKSTGKEVVSANDYYGMPEKENGDAYQTTKFEAKQTQKHNLSNHEYTGNSKKDVVEPVSYESIYNATINDIREETLKEREPTTTSTKMSSGMESVNNTKERNECDDRSYRATQNYEKVMASIPPAKEFVNMEHSDRAVESDRLDTTVLKSLKSNPFVVR
tara:strand:- start:4292 stop:6289 length:1998 start_codon:yes stop_codon:yes gene_type:complete